MIKNNEHYIYGVTMRHLVEVRNTLSNILSIDNKRREQLTEHSVLLGNVPELDSMAVVNVITALEENFDIIIDDEDISADIFETLGTLTTFIEKKLTE